MTTPEKEMPPPTIPPAGSGTLEWAGYYVKRDEYLIVQHEKTGDDDAVRAKRKSLKINQRRLDRIKREQAIARHIATRDAWEDARPWNDASERATTGEYHDHAIRESYEEREEHRCP